MLLASFILGVFAVIMTLILLPHAILGKPKIEFRFTTRDTESGRSLKCNIYNWPIQATILRVLGVYRATISQVFVISSIEDAKTSNIIEAEILSPIETMANSMSFVVSMPPSLLANSFSLVHTSVSGESYIVSGSADGKEYIHRKTLTIGEYIANMKIVIDGKWFTLRRKFFVGHTHDHLHWESEA